MKSLATISLIAAASILAATIAVGTFASPASALVVRGAPQSNDQTANANNNGLAGIAAAVNVQANGVGICVAAISSAC
jgi:FlaG/FlaF family flagellin (archaellin)